MDRRRSERTSVMLTARLKNADATRTVTVRNVSSHGALVQAEDLPAAGSRVTFRRDPLVFQCNIVWVQQQYGGVQFDQSFDRTAALRKIPTPKRAEVPRSKRSGLKCLPLSPEERRSLERWMFVDASGLLTD